MARGFLYLVAVMDWMSRYVLAWRLSNLLEASFCIEALKEALHQGRPEIFNTDQGSQFTDDGFTSMLRAHGVAISMDGRVKGTMSEAELHLLRARLLGGQLNKARRRRAVNSPPIGYVFDPLRPAHVQLGSGPRRADSGGRTSAV